ncbi:SNF2 family N-terminal domain-containing protein [Amylostereum chailletii]|nr:SNF2 family N-terminal domain-containing protein [Amylostereum chailletii]
MVPPPTPPSLTGPKRIKLIVRRPVPTYSHPDQRPKPPRFGNSIGKFLDSYTWLDDGEADASEEALAADAHEKALLREKVWKLRSQGRMLLSFDHTSVADRVVPPKERARGTDVWDHLLEDVRLRQRQTEFSGPQIAAAVAGKVRAFWDANAVKEGKARLQEEKRLRALAKTTMKMVVTEWKKAVYHIREQERLQREEEENRRGREHLDAILDQSGMILETQHQDLSRIGRSTSKSTSASLVEYGDTDDDEEEGSEDAEDVEEIAEEAASRTSVAEGDGRGGSAFLESRNPSGNLTDDEDDELTALALLGIPAPPRRASSSHSSHTSAMDDNDTDVDVDRTVTGPDDVFSPPSDLIATPPADDTPESAIATSFVDSPLRLEISSSTPMRGSGFKMDDPLPHPHLYDEEFAFEETMFRHEEEEESPAVYTPFLEETRSASDASAAISQEDALPPRALSNTGLLAEPSPLAVDRVSDLRPTVASSASPVLDIPASEKDVDEEEGGDANIPHYLRPYAVAPVEWDKESKVKPPALLRGVLRPYQYAGLEWLANNHNRHWNSILADEMGLGKTIQTIALLAHLACDRGIWGPHLIIVPTSVLLNWEMEFKKFLPGFKVLAYHGNTKRRKELRQGWYDKYHFNVCITSYNLASRDQHIFKRKPWYYMILDEAHMIKNFKSQRWNILLMFRSFRRLLLTGTPLQNNLTELWALLQFLMSGTDFANLKEFGEWFANPLEKAIESGGTLDDETQQRVSKLHTVLKPYLLRRIKKEVEKELPSKFEHLVLCPLSKRQRFLYDEFMSRAETRTGLSSGMYYKIANILMQLRKVCNHPDLFEVRPIVTSFAVQRSAVADYEIKELLVRRRLLQEDPAENVSLSMMGLHFGALLNTSVIVSTSTQFLDGTERLPFISELPGEPPPYDARTIVGHKRWREYLERAASVARWAHVGYLNRLRCNRQPILSSEVIRTVRSMVQPWLPASLVDLRFGYLDRVDAVHRAVKSYEERAWDMAPLVDRFAFATPAVVAHDLPRRALIEVEQPIGQLSTDTTFDAILHKSSVKLQIAFPDLSLLQFDCGKLQKLADLLRERKAGGHRVLIFTQMTKILDILEQFLNFHGYLYLRLDGATKIEDRQYITERFNADPRVFCFIASSRSGGVGINLTGADTVVFYDSDFNPQMDRQCEDRAHRIGQIRDVHIYRFISQHTVEEAMLRKANQKRSLDDIVIQKGGFDWRSLFGEEEEISEETLTKALEEFVDTEDAYAAKVAEKEAGELEGADEADFGEDAGTAGRKVSVGTVPVARDPIGDGDMIEEAVEEEEEEEGGTTVDYMLTLVRQDYEYFRDWRL